jgi:hypothetical protein
MPGPSARLSPVGAPSTFVVGVACGHRAAGLPFGRFEVTDDHLALHSWPRGRWVRSRSLAKTGLRCVEVAYWLGVTRFRFIDVEGQYADIKVDAGWRPRRIVNSLHDHGYVVRDERVGWRRSGRGRARRCGSSPGGA